MRIEPGTLGVLLWHTLCYIRITNLISGFGHNLAKHLDSLGATVFAGCLRDSSEGALWLKEKCSDRTHVLQMNVRDATQINQCLNYVKKHLPDEG